MIKVLTILLTLSILLIPSQAYAQSLSEIGKQLDQQNLDRAKELSQFTQEGGCPDGMIAKVVGLDVICVNDKAGQSASNLNTGDIPNLNYIIIGIFVLIIIVIVIAKAVQSEPAPVLYRDVKRTEFTPKTKRRIKELQKGRCGECGEYPTHWQFHHREGRGDNSIENCLGLCLNCHQTQSLHDDWRNTRT